MQPDTVHLKYGPPPDHTEDHRPKSYDEIKGAILDREGDFKYIQIFIKDTKTFKTKTVVRGYKSCNYHIDILQKFMYQEMEDIPRPTFKRLLIWCPGGGTIKKVYSDTEKKIVLFGKSSRYGQADHQRSKVILETDYFGHLIESTDEEFLDGKVSLSGDAKRAKPAVPLP